MKGSFSHPALRTTEKLTEKYFFRRKCYKCLYRAYACNRRDRGVHQFLSVIPNLMSFEPNRNRRHSCYTTDKSFDGSAP